jgi:hypothetical protein
MKRISLFLVFIAISVFFTGCYTQFIIPERTYDNDRYVQRDNDEEQNDDTYAEESDSTDAGYRYFDDYQNYQFHYYSPIYSRYYWGYYPGRIGFYDYGLWSDNYWAYSWWGFSPFYYDYYWHTGYAWSNYDWPYYYPRYNNGYWGGSGRYALNPFSKERRNDGDRLGFRRGSASDRYSSTSARSSAYTSGTTGGRAVVSGRSTTTTLGKDGTRTGSATSTARQGTRSGEKIYRNYDNSGRSRSTSKVNTPRQLGYSSPSGTARGSQSSSNTGRATTSSGSRGGSSYSAPSSSRSSSSGSSSSGRSSSSSSSSSRGSSSSSGSRGNSGGGGRGR